MKLLLPPVSLNDSVAQSVEQRPFKPWALGSSPSWITKAQSLVNIMFTGLFCFQGTFVKNHLGMLTVWFWISSRFANCKLRYSKSEFGIKRFRYEAPGLLLNGSLAFISSTPPPLFLLPFFRQG